MKYILKLYINGATANSRRAASNLKSICEEYLKKDRYEINIIDVLRNPEMAEKEKIIATPTLIKQLPPPLQKVIGDLSDKEKVLQGLELIRVDM